MAKSNAAEPESPLREVRFRAGGFAPTAKPSASIAAFVLTLAVWEGAVRAGFISPLFLPAPSAVLQALVELARTGALWQNVGVSLERIAAGWAIGTAAGVAAGVAMGLWSVWRSVGLAFVAALFPIPKIALLPLLILWLGIGETSKVATIALGVFFPTVIAVYSGVDSVPRNLIRMAQSFGVPYGRIIWKVILPGALPYVMAGFRITTSTALILLVSAEMIGAQYGIGAFILQTGNMMMTDQLLAGVALLSMLGVLISWTLGRAERALFRWR